MRSRFDSHYQALHRTRLMQRVFLFASFGFLASLLLAFFLVVKLRVSNASQNIPVVKESQSKSVPVATITVYSPERLIRAGTRMSDVRFKNMYWPRNQVAEGIVRDLHELQDKYAKQDISPGTPIQLSHLTDRPAETVLSLTPGNRAVTLSVDAETSIEYHVLPGTSVEVVLTHFVNREVISRVLVENARVLSLGGNTSKESFARAPIKSKTVTLDVSQKDALRIVTAKQMGKLSLLMRTSGEPESVPISPVLGSEIGNDYQEHVEPNHPCGKLKVDGNTISIDCAQKWVENLHRR